VVDGSRRSEMWSVTAIGGAADGIMEMNKFWVKLHISTLADADLAMIDDEATRTQSAWRFFIECLMICGEADDNEGWLPCDRNLAWRLRRDEENVGELLRRLKDAGMVAKSRQGWRVINFAKYQAPVPARERKAASRARLNSKKKELVDALK